MVVRQSWSLCDCARCRPEQRIPFKSLPGLLSNLETIGYCVSGLRMIGDSNAQVGVLFAQWNLIKSCQQDFAVEAHHHLVYVSGDVATNL